MDTRKQYIEETGEDGSIFTHKATWPVLPTWDYVKWLERRIEKLEAEKKDAVNILVSKAFLTIAKGDLK